ncbi:MAG: excinuclease ABC subunit UvrA [Muribaculaceae bacterium]|nr:excinuclease ABC subunit UvrA [Muribaculaceae bacterium]
MNNENNITVKGAHVNNLKGVNVEIPRNRLIVITGLSGSGKSSLAFDTLYAEGQRRYVESLSAYARQFLKRMSKPEVDMIKGLPPAIAIEQKVNTRNPRSTVGTSTEIYDYLRLLFGRVGHTISPVSGNEVKKHTVEDVLGAAAQFPDGTRIAVTVNIKIPEGRTLQKHLEVLMKQGYSRVISPDGQFIAIEDIIKDADLSEKNIPALVIDRLAVAHEGDELSRLAESAETAFYEGNGQCTLLVWNSADRHAAPAQLSFSNRFEADGIKFEEPSDQMFNFNNPYGACPECEGFGMTIGIDERLVVPNMDLSIYDEAIACWKGEKMSEWKRNFIHIAGRIGFPVHKPYSELTDEQKHILWHGNGEFLGSIDDFFKMVDENQYKIQYRVLKARYRGKTICPVCHGTRLKKTAQYVKVAGKSITDLVRMPIWDLQKWISDLKLEGNDALIGRRLVTELKNRIGFLVDVGVGYLTLDRLSSSLSGGESQRINLATSLGSALVGSMYILDEPSIGLHSRDTERLIGVLRKLQSIGNTVIVVEHDEEIMRAADYIIDVGPDAGSNGGQIVFQGTPGELENANGSHTADFLTGKDKIDIPKSRRKWRDRIVINGASQNNLKNVDVEFPLGVLTVVTGVSGSGKSTLVRDILYRAMLRQLGEPGDAPGTFKALKGDLSRVSRIEFVDQNPIGKSTRSNPATYLKAFDEIRNLMASQQLSKQMGYTPAYFSFNAEGGRCEECKGEGVISIEMQFMADLVLTCEACHGKRYKHDILEVTYRGKNISDILDLTVDDAIKFFSESDGSTERKIVKRLKPLQDVGLGYITLGQSSSTLSGGENQRVKLAYYLSLERQEPTMFIFDEPTTGLHFHDIKRLLDSFQRLLALGHTVIIIEHNLDVIKTADHVIDIGPEGGDAGGNIVCTGTPEDIAACDASQTGRYLKDKLAR